MDISKIIAGFIVYGGIAIIVLKSFITFLELFSNPVEKIREQQERADEVEKLKQALKKQHSTSRILGQNNIQE